MFDINAHNYQGCMGIKPDLLSSAENLNKSELGHGGPALSETAGNI